MKDLPGLYGPLGAETIRRLRTAGLAGLRVAQSLRLLQELRRPQLERIGDAAQRIDGDVASRALDQGDVRAVKFGLFGEGFLGEAVGLAALTDGKAEPGGERADHVGTLTAQ